MPGQIPSAVLSHVAHTALTASPSPAVIPWAECPGSIHSYYLRPDFIDYMYVLSNARAVLSSAAPVVSSQPTAPYSETYMLRFEFFSPKRPRRETVFHPLPLVNN